MRAFLTFQEADAGLGKLLHQPPHKELRAKELGGDEGSILGEADFIWRELTPLPKVKGTQALLLAVEGTIDRQRVLASTQGLSLI